MQLIRELRPLLHCTLVLTTTHKEHLDALAGQDTGAFEVVGKPYDIETIADAVVQGLKRRDTREVRQFGQT